MYGTRRSPMSGGGGAGGGSSGADTGWTKGHHARGSQTGLSNGRKAELTSAYSALAAELTRKEIKTIGGYALGRVIGEGSFGTVRIGVHRLTNTRVAIKQVPKSLSNSSDPSSPLSLLTREIHHHRRLRHPHVLALYEVIATESSIYLVTELCTGGELFDYLVEKGRLSTSECRRIFGQLVLGVAHLHQTGVVHRDLKLENVLLDEQVNVKIADMGFGREFEKGRWMETWVGTLGYCAPEVVAAKKYLGEEVDIWSLGVILYTLISGSLPFDDDEESVMKEKILKCDYDVPAWVDEDAADLILKILVLDPLRRPSLKAILSHPFFTSPPSQSYLRATPVASPQPAHDRGSVNHLTTSNMDSARSSFEIPRSPPLQPYGSSSLPAEKREADIGSRPSVASLTGTKVTEAASYSQPAAVVTTLSAEDVLAAPSKQEEEKHSAVQTGELESQSKLSKEDEKSGQFLKTSSVKGLLSENETEGAKGDHKFEQQGLSTPSERGRERMSGVMDVEATNDLYPNPIHSSKRTSNSPASMRSYLGIVAPPLQRELSASSATSAKSGAASPVPIHSRTPSRTKRRSVGSMYSERLFSLDEEPPSPPVDYLALLSTVAPTPLSSASEKGLLESLTILGFDSGQIVHSITTHACDSCAAIWWMLRKSSEEREKEKEKEEKEKEASEPIEGMNPSPAIVKSEPTQWTRAGPTIEEVASEDTGDDENQLYGESQKGSPRSTIASAPTQPVAHITPPELPDSPSERLSYFLSDQPLNSASLLKLDYFPTTEGGSPQRKVQRSDSKDHLNTPPPGSSTGISPGLSPLAPLQAPDSPGSPDMVDSKKGRARSSSVSMLARATSAFGSSLALKKLSDTESKAPDDTKTTPTSGRSIFNRKASFPNEKLSTLDDHTSRNSNSAPSSPIEKNDESVAPATPPKEFQENLPSQKPSTIATSDSQSTFDTVNSSPASVKRTSYGSNTIAMSKQANKSTLFSNFKLWFGDDRKKRKRNTVGNIDGLTASQRPLPIARRAMRPDGTYIASPLTRPPLSSRRSSIGSGMPPSRRSSTASISRSGTADLAGSVLSPSSGRHSRRRSDGSRASNSDREHSRPPSIRSNSGTEIPVASRRRHSRGASQSSISSHATSPITAKDVYRRPLTSTTVRRHHQHRSTHSRNRSASSSTAGRHSDSSDIGEDEASTDELQSTEPIIEEDEEEHSEKHTERQRALRKLSGDMDGLQLSGGGGATDLTKKSASSLSLASNHSSSARHSHVVSVFSAHKTHHVFGAPSQPIPSTISQPVRKVVQQAPLRDVFANKDREGEWVDEDDFEGYGGGLGQPSQFSNQKDARPSSDGSGVTKGKESFEGGTSMGRFEGRYAGVQSDPAQGASNWRSGQSKGAFFRSPIAIEEEEEDN